MPDSSPLQSSASRNIGLNTIDNAENTGRSLRPSQRVGILGGMQELSCVRGQRSHQEREQSAPAPSLAASACRCQLCEISRAVPATAVLPDLLYHID